MITTATVLFTFHNFIYPALVHKQSNCTDTEVTSSQDGSAEPATLDTLMYLVQLTGMMREI